MKRNFFPGSDNQGYVDLIKNNEGDIMHKLICLTILLTCLFLNVSNTLAQGDLLNETPLHAIPEEMTFEEYQDANRRMLSGILVSSLVPVPGMMHFYAGEKKTRYRLLAVSGIGVLSILGGLASMTEEGDGWLDTDYETVDIGTERYEKIPVLIYEENGEENTGYSLRKLPKEHEGGALGVSLMILGGGAIIACHLYDWIHGIHTIETKRDRVRFKYGKQLSFSMDPMIDLDRQFAGVSLGVRF